MEQRSYIGNCVNDEVVDAIFGSVSEFANQVEENGDNFTYGNITVEYDEITDIHSFWHVESLYQEDKIMKDELIATIGLLNKSIATGKGFASQSEELGKGWRADSCSGY